ncbi:uncharacterized protein J3R85_004089 [Psidium guajava]|nr:uncharacterized protein J3R85_004089 [Psidium guajava]
MGLHCCSLPPTELRNEHCSKAGTEPTEFDLRGGIAGTVGSSSKDGATASSDMGSFGQDMPGKTRPDHRDLSMDNGWDMDPDDKDCGDVPPGAHDNAGVYKEPAPIPGFPNDPYNPYGPPLSQWQGQFMYCSPMSCQGRKEYYGPGAGGDCAGFNMLIEYPPPIPVDQPGVSRKPVYPPNRADHHGHTVAFGEPVAFPPSSYTTELSDIPGRTWAERTMPGQ